MKFRIVKQTFQDGRILYHSEYKTGTFCSWEGLGEPTINLLEAETQIDFRKNLNMKSSIPSKVEYLDR